jgi:CheY-like chemotaxis protein
VLILDLHMPGLSGSDVIRELRASGAETPIIVSSASVDKATEAAVRAVGANGFVPKPSPDFVVLDAIAKATGVALVDEAPHVLGAMETPRPTPAPSPEALRALPADLRARLTAAVRGAQAARIAEIGAEIASHDAAAAAFVRDMADQFRYGAILEALE